MKKIVLGIIGEISTGKTTATDYLKEKYNSKTARFSNVLRDLLDRCYLPKTRENLQIISQSIRENFSQDILSKILVKDIENFDSEIVVVEGIRRPSDVPFLKDAYPDNFFTIYINTDEKLRFKRLTSRTENPDDTQKTWEQFQKDGQAEAEMAIKKIANKANYTINNSGTLEEFYKSIEEILERLLRTSQ